MKFWIFSLLPLICWGTVNEPVRLELISGYRNDRVHWHLQLPGEGGALTYSERYRDLQFWENGLTLKAIHRDLVFFLLGSYAAFGKGGTLFQRYADLSFTSIQPRFQFVPDGWAADASGYFGYAVNLTQDRTYKVILIPLVGYLARFERLNRAGGNPEPYASNNAVGASSFTMRSALPSQLHQTWYGFYLGGQFQVEPGGRFVLQAGYAYHWLHCRFKTHLQNQVELFNPGPVLISDQTTLTKIDTSEGSNLGHKGWVQLDYPTSQAWRLGIGGQIYYFASRILDAALHSKVNGVASSASEKFKLRWTSVSGWVQVSREI